MGDINQCAWKLVIPSEFVMGMEAERCGLQADVRILRPQRKTDLYLCEDHLNHFIKEWGLHYEVEILWEEEEVDDSPCQCVGCGTGKACWKEILFRGTK